MRTGEYDRKANGRRAVILAPPRPKSKPIAAVRVVLFQIIMTLSGERPALQRVFEYPPEKTRNLES